MQNLKVDHRYLSASPHLLFLVESATDFARRRCYFVAEKPVDGTVYLQDRGEGNGIGQQQCLKQDFCIALWTGCPPCVSLAFHAI